ncbi:MAG TPA: hypothetical protein DDW27_05795 [Bacteroidales bacterium]|nr:hypothetical protein [Bacteroidales bacterium]
MPEDQTKNPKYFLNKWITRGIKKAGSREQGAGGAELRAQTLQAVALVKAWHRAQALQAEAFFGIRSFSEGFSEGLAHGKKAVGGEQGAGDKM